MKLSSFFKYLWENHNPSQDSEKIVLVTQPLTEIEKIDAKIFKMLKKDELLKDLSYAELTDKLKEFYDNLAQLAKAKGQNLTEAQFKQALYKFTENTQSKTVIDLTVEQACKESKVYSSDCLIIVPSYLLLSEESNIDYTAADREQKTYDYLKAYKPKNIFEQSLKLLDQVNLFIKLYKDKNSNEYKNELKYITSEIIKLNYKAKSSIYANNSLFKYIHGKLKLSNQDKKEISRELLFNEKKSHDPMIQIINLVIIGYVYSCKDMLIKKPNTTLLMISAYLYLFAFITFGMTFSKENKELIETGQLLPEDQPSFLSYFYPMNLKALKFEKRNVAADVTKKELAKDYASHEITSLSAFFTIAMTINLIAYTISNSLSANNTNLYVKIINHIVKLTEAKETYMVIGAAALLYGHLKASYEHQEVNESKGKWTSLLYPAKLYEAAAKNSIELY